MVRCTFPCDSIVGIVHNFFGSHYLEDTRVEMFPQIEVHVFWECILCGFMCIIDLDAHCHSSSCTLILIFISFSYHYLTPLYGVQDIPLEEAELLYLNSLLYLAFTLCLLNCLYDVIFKSLMAASS